MMPRDVIKIKHERLQETFFKKCKIVNRENIYLTQEILHLEQQIWGPGIAITDLKSYFFQK